MQHIEEEHQAGALFRQIVLHICHVCKSTVLIHLCSFFFKLQLSLQELEKDVTKLESELQLTRDESKTKEKEQHDEVESLRQEIQLRQVENEKLKKEVHRLKEQVQLLQDDNEYMEEQMQE